MIAYKPHGDSLRTTTENNQRHIIERGWKMMRKIFAFTLAVLMLSVLLIPAVQAIMVHDHGEVCALFAVNACCSNPNYMDFIDHHKAANGMYCYGTTYHYYLNCHYYTSGSYTNGSRQCISTCYLPSWDTRDTY